VLVTAAAWLAGRRDLGASALPARDERRAHTRFLGGPTRFAARLVVPAGLGWIAGIGALALVLGLVAKVAASSISGSARIKQILAQLGGYRTGAAAYLGFSFVIIAILVALVAASQVAATRDEEAQARVEHLLVRAVSRPRWLGGRVTVAAVLVVTCAVAAGVLAWVGAALQDSGVSLRDMIEAGVNVAAPAVLVLGVGTLLHGLWPRAATIGAYGLVAWSFLVQIVGALVKADHWVLDTSILHHVTPAPAASVDWTGVAVLVALGLASAVVGVLAFDRRDLAGA
jgi:ABC-2 type transport system permease protein